MTRRPELLLSPLAAALSFALLSAAAHAEPLADAGASAAGEAKNLDAIEVHGQRIEKASSPKYTEPLLDTPQTITVINRETMAQQNLTGLRDVLSTLPGITFGAGEGGGGYGDKINLRGFTADADITTDGVRDSALYSRTDTFNLEAIELVNGANSAYSGAGSVGGSINLVSKMAHAGDAHMFTLGAGTDRYGRLTADSNLDFDNGVAVRLNAMAHQNDVPGRDHEAFQRWGFAPSIAFGLGSDTRFALNYLHQQDDNLPQYGLPYALNAFNDGPYPGVDRQDYFGYRNVSDQEIEVDMLTGIFEHDFNDRVGLRSLARVQRVDQLSNVTALQGTWCLDSGINPFTGAACAAPGTWNPNNGPRGFVRDTRNFIAVSQTDLTARFATGAVEHALVAGVAFSKEDFDLDTGTVFNNANGSAVTAFPIVDIHDPYNIWTGPLNYFSTSRSHGTLENQAIYVFDTLKFGPRWSLNLGARYEHNEGDSYTWNASTANATRGQYLTPRPAAAGNEDDLFSYRAGLVFKPVENASLYFAYSNANTPSRASVNGSCTASGGAAVAAGTANCTAEPESAVNLELGAKWELLDRRLALTAALFRNERENYRVNDPDPLNLNGEQSLDGRARVDGLTLGVAGNLTRAWSLFANYTWLDSEVLSGVSDYCAANPNTHIVTIAGTATAVNADGRACANSTHFPDPFKGNALANTPRHSADLWTTYALTQWTFGYGITYQGEYITQNNSLPTVAGVITAGTLADPVAMPLYETPDYWVHRAMVGYAINDQLALQLNLNNLFDETYYTRIRNTATSGWATPGEGRSAVLTATYRF